MEIYSLLSFSDSNWAHLFKRCQNRHRCSKTLQQLVHVAYPVYQHSGLRKIKLTQFSWVIVEYILQYPCPDNLPQSPGLPIDSDSTKIRYNLLTEICHLI